MADILDEASDLVQCKECLWYKSCVMPMRFTVDDLRRQMPDSSSFAAGDAGISRYLGELASATQNFLLEGCPVFIERLRANPRLAERIKKMMKNWGMEQGAEP